MLFIMSPEQQQLSEGSMVSPGMFLSVHFGDCSWTPSTLFFCNHTLPAPVGPESQTGSIPCLLRLDRTWGEWGSGSMLYERIFHMAHYFGFWGENKGIHSLCVLLSYVSLLQTITIFLLDAKKMPC